MNDRKPKKDGSYRDAKLKGLREAGAYDFLSEIQDELTKNKFNWRNFTERGDKSFHPRESNGYLATIITMRGIDFNLQFTKRKIISLQVIYTKRTKEKLGKNVVGNLEREPYKLSENIEIGTAKADFKYSWITINNIKSEHDSIQSALHGLRVIDENIA